ncbi:head-tail adaptor protein [Vibrio parahaemolyticus]|nr:head-tail adaptor protein [Vibrio parahaemolyticus]EHU0344309.1 head-tail adaptor protein [Vibrio parahaemolyticus]EHU0354343.1 head-tail adaptor protein [Vibrio parahaemolyticus]
MRIGLLRTPIEIWDVQKKLNDYGVYEETKELLLSCPAAINDETNEITGDNTKSIINTLDITIRFNRYFKAVSSSMYVMLDGNEYDIITPPNNNWRLNKYVRFKAVLRNK